MKKKLFSLFMAAAVMAASVSAPAANAATGDAEAVTYVENMYKAANTATSFEAHVDATVTLSMDEVLLTSDIKLLADMLQAKNGDSSVDFNIDLGMLGTMLGISSIGEKVIAVKDGDKVVTYVYDSTTSSWSKSTQSASTMTDELTTTINSSAPLEALANLKIKTPSVVQNGKDCVVVTGEVTGEYIAGVMEKELKSGYKSQEKEIKSLEKQLKKQKKAVKKKKGSAKKKAKKAAAKTQKQLNSAKKYLKKQKKADSAMLKLIKNCQPMTTEFTIEKATSYPVRIKVDAGAFIASYSEQTGEPMELEEGISLKNFVLAIDYKQLNGDVAITVPPEALNAPETGTSADLGTLY